MTELVLYQVKKNVAWLTLNQAQTLNVLNKSLLEALSFLLTKAQADKSIKACVITGDGKAFSAGADIAYLSQSTPLEIRELAQLAVQVNHQIESANKPVIAMINGYALGGGLEIAEACWLRVASDKATFGHPEVALGTVAGFGGTTRLPRLVGKGYAAQLLLTGKVIDAKEALRVGLVNEVVAPNQLSQTTQTLLDVLLSKAPIAVSLSWQALHRGLNLTLEESAQLGADYFGLAATTDDFHEGTHAFLGKRKAKFTGK